MDRCPPDQETHAERGKLRPIGLALVAQLFFTSSQSIDIAKGFQFVFIRGNLVFNPGSLFLDAAVNVIRRED